MRIKEHYWVKCLWLDMLQAQEGITNIVLLNGYSTKMNPSELVLYPWIQRYIQLSTII